MGHPANHLIHESSPYLLQHAYNPVDWHPWGDMALDKAHRENKLIIISVGYAACHWCHVMEHESFENADVAAVMNEFFVSIKVDREERPDIDQIYMDAVQLMTGSGGWPLNCVCLPDGRPIWGGTYFQKRQWIDVLDQLAEFWRRSPDEARGYAERLTDAVRKMDEIVPVAVHKPFSLDFLESILKPWRGTFDLKWGGYGRTPKFPMPNNWQFLLRESHFSGNAEQQAALAVTLERMAWGGIYDQLGGGFARYSVDGIWKVPHFEKMTYDNGQLISLYAEAHLKQPDPLYERVVAQTFAWMEREMLSPEGGWYSSLDADSEGVEGKFYVWTKAEIDALLGNDSGWYCAYYQVVEQGNWEHGNNILMMGQSPAAFAAARGLSEEALLHRVAAANAILLQARDPRIRPGLDDKVLASWNALMLKGCVDAFRAFGDASYHAAALRNAHFIADHLMVEGRLMRNFKTGKASIPAFLDDHALVAEAFVALYQITFDQQWLTLAQALVEQVIAHFYNAETQLFFFTSDQDPALITRKMELMDNVIPASNSVMANVLFDLGHLLSRNDYVERAERMLQNVQGDMPRYGGGYSNWGLLMLKFLRPFLEVVVTGPDALAYAAQIQKTYLPNQVIAAATTPEDQSLSLLDDRFVDGQTLIYVCVNSACQLPVSDVESAIKLMRQLSLSGLAQ
jgi:uncharacterized protein